MMLKYNQQPVQSEYRHYQSQACQAQWFQPYTLQEHITTTSQQHYEKSFAVNPSRPHLNIKLDNKHTVRALVDSGSSICLGDSSLLPTLITSSQPHLQSMSPMYIKEENRH